MLATFKAPFLKLTWLQYYRKPTKPNAKPTEFLLKTSSLKPNRC